MVLIASLWARPGVTGFIVIASLCIQHSTIHREDNWATKDVTSSGLVGLNDNQQQENVSDYNYRLIDLQTN